MPNYLLAFHNAKMPESEAAQAAARANWDTWFSKLGPKIVDRGNPVGQAKTINKDRSVTNEGGSNPVSGYAIIAADNMDLAIDLTKDCPILFVGGNVEVCETFAVM